MIQDAKKKVEKVDKKETKKAEKIDKPAPESAEEKENTAKWANV